MNRKKIVAMVLTASLMGSLLSGCGGQKSAETSTADKSGTVKIGFLGDLSGDYSMYGKPSLNGAQMAIDEINAAGGVNGQQLELVANDDRASKQEAATIAQKIVNRDKVVAIIGDPTTGLTKVAGPIAQKAGIVEISPNATGPGVVEIGDGLFRATLLDSVAIPAIMDYFSKDLGFKKVAVITSDNNDYSVGMSDTFKKAIVGKDVTIVADEKIKDGDKDFSAQITNIKAKNPDVIFFSGYYTEGALICKEAQKQGLKAPLFGGDGVSSPKMVEIGGSAVEGSMTFLGFSPDQPTPETAKFLQDYKAKYGSEADVFAAQSYDAVKILVAAMQRAKSNDPKAFKPEVANTKNFVGVSGTITFKADHEPVKSPVFLLEIKNGKYVLKKKVPVPGI